MGKEALALARVAAMSLPELRSEWERVCGNPVPLLPIELLRRALAQRCQEKRHGSLPAPVARELLRIASGGRPKVHRHAHVAIRSGARLIREWQGRTISVEVIEGGFLWEGQRYASLSSIAKLVTGAHWSGPRFFGVAGRG